MTTCPANSITFNTTLCACPPGFILNGTNNTCSLFNESSTIFTGTGVDLQTVSFPETIFSFDTIRKFTQSQAVFLEATLVLVLSWLGFCLFLRFMKLGDGRNPWFNIRWWVSRLDVCFATRHWLDDQKVVVKRKTELGGAFSIASWILFIGLFAALLYQIITKRNIEVHNVKATNAPDLAAFVNDMEFNLTTVSSMSCLNLRGLQNLVTGSPGFFDQRVAPLSAFANFTCLNSSTGPTITFKCSKCQLNTDYMYISWQFVDIPSSPAAAVGFQFNLIARSHAINKHVSFVSGLLRNGSAFDDRPVTFRGKDTNILKFHIFPRIYHNLHDLRLLQPLFHEFVPGSFSRATNQLQASLENPTDGLINTTLYINYLSAYIVEVQNKSILGPVSFLADLGGLYCISIGIFFYLLVQCEYRIKRLRNEDSEMRKIRRRLKAQEHWRKLRKYVMYRWSCTTLEDDDKNTTEPSCSHFLIPPVPKTGSLHGIRSSHKKSQKRMDSIALNKKFSSPGEKKTVECTNVQGEKSSVIPDTSNSVKAPSKPRGEHCSKDEMLSSVNEGKQHSVGLHGRSAQSQDVDTTAIPPPPPLEFKEGSESEIQKNLQSLYEYNVMLREKFLATQSLLETLASKSFNSRTQPQT